MVGLSLYHTGHCRHPEWSTRRDRSLRPCRFPMHAAVLDRGGDLAVFDTGYAPRFFAASQPFPERVYRWLTPTEAPAADTLAARLAATGAKAAVRTIIVSHFHADHVAGLRDFPAARIWCSRRAWDHLRGLSRVGAVRAGYLRALLPPDIEDRLGFVDDLPTRALPPGFHPFDEGRDLFGDGTVLLLPLPGHSTGQIGAAFTGPEGVPHLLIADASWSVAALRDDVPPPGLTLRFIGSAAAFHDTWGKLRHLMQGAPDTRLIACHCATSSAPYLVARPSDPSLAQ